jgi:lipopolysaccharide/colanic/teichoic acid biosynthesis glycosyltransferase
MIKRGFDILVASLGLLVLWPAFLAIGLAIKIDSPGPVFFRQERIGRHGEPFRIFKFRTMHVHQPSSARQFTAADDPRITCVGAWLRRTKLDELAQLIDVLRGTMSLVGPRPEVPRYVAFYPPEIRHKVLSIRPGITDPASIAYRDEAALLARAADPEREYIDVIMPAKLRFANRYVDSMSMTNDLGLIASTLKALLRR